MYLCNDCDALFDGDFGIGCPECGSWNTSEVEECVCCGRIKRSEDMLHSVCKDCFNKSLTVETATAVGEEYTESMEINGFYYYLLGEERIKPLLENAVTNTRYDVLQADAKIYLEADPDSTAEFVHDREFEDSTAKKRTKKKYKKDKKER